MMIQPGTPVQELDTPCMLVDLDRMEANIRRWQARVDASGVALRPHIKTHKVPAIAHQQLAAGAAGITTAKLAEAEVFAAHGCRDIFVAYPIVGPQKWRRAAKLAGDCALIVGVDSAVGAHGLSAAAVAAGTTVGVRIEINSGLNRAGVIPGQAATLCQTVLDLPGLELDGIFTFRGVGFPSAGGRAAAELGREEGELMADLAQQLRASDIPIRSVSVGSTPTGQAAAQVPGITEVRPGTYVFGDYLTAEGGYVGYDEVALSILCTVVSRPAADKATIDAGSKTFSGDILPASKQLKGYGRAVDREAYVEVVSSEEHGIVQLGPGVDPQLGEKIAFYPIHVCTTVNLADELIGVRDGHVELVWPILARGKRT